MRKPLVLTVWLMFGVLVAAAGFVLFPRPDVSSSGSDEITRVIDVSNLKPGEILKVNMKYPVWILYRSEKMIEDIGAASELADPESVRSIQPPNARNPYRSISPKYFVFVPLFDWTNKYSGWHGYLEVKEAGSGFDNDKRWWFVDNVGKGLGFDLSGRVFRYESFDWLQEANNVVVPNYEYLGSGDIKIDLSNLHLSSDPFE